MTFIETLYGGKSKLNKFVVAPKRQLPPATRGRSQLDRLKFGQLQDLMLIKLLSGGK